MRILISDPTYPNDEENHDKFVEELKNDLIKDFGRAELQEVDAGPGAADPAFFWTLLEAVAIALAVFSAPKVLKDNLPLWKAYFDRVRAFLTARNLKFSVDAECARNLAVFYVLNKTAGGYENVRVASHTLHWTNAAEFAADELRDERADTDENDQFRDHHQAVKLRFCRHVICVQVDYQYFTVIIEKDGSCSYLEKLF